MLALARARVGAALVTGLVVGIASPGGAGPATSTQARGSALAVPPTSPAPLACGKPPVLSLGEEVPTTDLAAVDFLTPDIGLGLVAKDLGCAAPTSATAKETVGLARSTDGGQSWAVVIATGPANVATQPFGPITLAFSSATTGWVSANGSLEETVDGGHDWRSVRLGPGHVLTVTRTGSVIEAVTSGPSWASPAWPDTALRCFLVVPGLLELLG